MGTLGTFPFGQPVEPLVQQDRGPKKVFVLGVYASAVHARWIGPNGKNRVQALAVASEPYIFWRGEGADEIIAEITIPEELGRLVPAADKFNGPSGVALDEMFLDPLGIGRDDAWLCDLVPHSCVNSAQQKAIDSKYAPMIERFDLQVPSVPPVPKVLTDDSRRLQILEEVRESQADLLVLLGDKPIQCFLKHFDDRWKKLADFSPYGRRHRVNLDGLKIDILPLAHPRQVAKLGMASKKWYELHQEWMESVAPTLLCDLSGREDSMKAEETPFRDDNVWFFDDLKGSDLERAKEAGCEPGSAYYGEPFSDNEIPTCSFCDTPVWHPLKDWGESGCKHLMFAYDMEAGFVYIRPEFVTLFWRKFYPGNERRFDGDYEADELSAVKKAGEIPAPYTLYFVSALDICRQSSHFGIMGIECGFMEDV